jgi:hypothetical protein
VVGNIFLEDWMQLGKGRIFFEKSNTVVELGTWNIVTWIEISNICAFTVNWTAHTYIN